MKTLSDLQVDDMNVGDSITVTIGRMMEISNCGKNPRIEEEIKFKGMLLKIVAMDLPYIIVDKFQINYKKPVRNSIDTRTMTFKKLTSEYVSAFLQEEADYYDEE